MSITLIPIGSPKGGDQLLHHDLNFQQERYESTHSVTFRNPKGELLEALRQSGSVGDAGATNGASSAAKPEKKRQKQQRNVDMEKLAEALPQLAEDDLLQVVQMVHDNKSEETYTKNDVESKFRGHIGPEHSILTPSQMESSTWISIPSPIRSSRCSGTLPRSALI